VKPVADYHSNRQQIVPAKRSIGLLAYMFFPSESATKDISDKDSFNGAKTTHSRFSQWLWNTGLDALDFCGSKTGVGALVLRTAEARADRALEVDGGSDRGLSLATFNGTFTGHCEREKNYQEA
jgi:hypothetical protein